MFSAVVLHFIPSRRSESSYSLLGKNERDRTNSLSSPTGEKSHSLPHPAAAAVPLLPASLADADGQTAKISKK